MHRRADQGETGRIDLVRCPRGDHDRVAPITQSELVEAIRNATHEVFSMMLSLELAPGEVFVEKEEPAPASGVVSLRGLAGPWVGSGSLSCTAEFACKIAS